MTALLCRILGHKPLSGVNVTWSLIFHCARCQCLVRGSLANAR